MSQEARRPEDHQSHPQEGRAEPVHGISVFQEHPGLSRFQRAHLIHSHAKLLSSMEHRASVNLMKGRSQSLNEYDDALLLIAQ